MTHTVFDKTAKGREEIATRKYLLAPRLRTLLVLVDGKQTSEDLLIKVAGIGLTKASIAELLDNGFIQPATASRISVGSDAAADSAPAASTLPDGQNQFQAAYQFYTQTIKSTIGLRGYALQLSVEKATSIDDFRELRQPYLDAVLKAKGADAALDLRQRLDQVLYSGENSPPTAIIELSAASGK